MRHHLISDLLGLVDALALAATLRWVLRENLDYSGWRNKCALAALAFGWASGVMLLIIFVHASMDFNEAGDPFPSQALIIVMLSLTGLVLALIGKGRPKILALLWCGGLFVIFAFFFVLLFAAFGPTSRFG